MEAEIIDIKTNKLIEIKITGQDIPSGFRDGETITTKHGPRTIVRASMETKPVHNGFITTFYKVWVK